MELAAGTLLLLLPALINGYPLVFPDTGAYLRQAIELHGAPDRPPYYSLLIFPMHLMLSLWPVIAMQSLAIATALWVMVYLTIPGARTLHYLIVTAVLTAFTSVGWHADQIMPDAFTGLLTIVVFVIAWGWNDQAPPARVALVLAACGITTLHYTHLPLAIGLFAVAALVSLAQGAGWREVRRVAVIGAAVSAVGSAAFVAYSLALVHRPVLSPNGNIFLAARVLADGPGRDWLAASCPDSGNAFCKYRDRISANADVFLWDPTSPLRDVLRDVGPEQTRRAAAQIVAGAITIRPGAQLAASLANFASQLVHFGALDTECPEHCGETEAVNQTIKRHFPREYQQFRHSLQMTGRLPVRAIRRMHSVVVIIALIIALVLVVAMRHGDRLTAGFVLLVAATLGLNAILSGVLSGPHDRYQSRVVWLLPLGALLAVGRRWRFANHSTFCAEDKENRGGNRQPDGALNR
jgi:hypothetical protein